MDRDAPIRVRLARHSVRCTTDRSTPELTTVAVAGHTIDSTNPGLHQSKQRGARSVRCDRGDRAVVTNDASTRLEDVAIDTDEAIGRSVQLRQARR